MLLSISGTALYGLKYLEDNGEFMKSLIIALMLIAGLAEADTTREVEADEIKSSDQTKTYTLPPVTSKLMGIIKLTSDPCLDSASYPEGAIFYNDSSDYYCFCDGLGIDKQLHDPSQACF